MRPGSRCIRSRRREGTRSGQPARRVLERPAELAHIKQAAHSRGRSPDVVCTVVLARIAGSINHTIKLPALTGRKPTWLISSRSTVRPVVASRRQHHRIELLPAGPEVVDQVTRAAGKAWSKSCSTSSRSRPRNGKVTTGKRQAKWNAIIYVDEGEALTALGRGTALRQWRRCARFGRRRPSARPWQARSANAGGGRAVHLRARHGAAPERAAICSTTLRAERRSGSYGRGRQTRRSPMSRRNGPGSLAGRTVTSELQALLSDRGGI